MDIEQLKLVIETVKSVSGDAQAVAIWWLVLDKLLPIIAWLIVGCGVFKIATKIINAIATESNNEDRLKELCDILYPSGSGYVCDHNYKKMVVRARELAEKN